MLKGLTVVRGLLQTQLGIKSICQGDGERQKSDSSALVCCHGAGDKQAKANKVANDTENKKGQRGGAQQNPAALLRNLEERGWHLSHRSSLLQLQNQKQKQMPAATGKLRPALLSENEEVELFLKFFMAA